LGRRRGRRHSVEPCRGMTVPTVLAVPTAVLYLCRRPNLCRRWPSAQVSLCRRLAYANGHLGVLARCCNVLTAPTKSRRQRRQPSAPWITSVVKHADFNEPLLNAWHLCRPEAPCPPNHRLQKHELFTFNIYSDEAIPNDSKSIRARWSRRIDMGTGSSNFFFKVRGEQYSYFPSLKNIWFKSKLI
jgi:hypothetical protein